MDMDWSPLRLRYDFEESLTPNQSRDSEGEFWMRERWLAQPAFHREQLTKYADMVDATNQLLTRWREAPRTLPR